jgi:hypothetical protein
VPELPPLVPDDVFSDLPRRLRSELLDSFGRIVQNYSERRWEPAELNGGKLCEVVYSIVRGKADGKYPARASKPKNMVLACQQMEQETSEPRSIRIQIPRMIVALYEIRNNRNVGHVGGDVDPNQMDSICVLQMSKWLVAELVRVLHHRPVDEAAEIVDALVQRETPLIWKVGDRRRVLDTSLTMKEKMLVLLHATAGPMTAADIIDFIEHSNPSVFRRDVLRPAHKTRLVEYDDSAGIVTISPLGVEVVDRLLAARRAA